MWRFRWSLVAEPAALTRMLQCVDWSDALEARQAGELMAAWAPIAAAQALQLLSPDFPQPEVWCPVHCSPLLAGLLGHFLGSEQSGLAGLHA